MASRWENRVRKTTNAIFQGIRSLYRISTFLRWSRSSSEYSQSSNSTVPSHDALVATLENTLILRKIRQWRSFKQEGQAAPESGLEQEKENKDDGIADIAFFCQRLTWANVLRRKQFHHWDEIPDVPESQARALDDSAARKYELEGQTASSSRATLPNVASSAYGSNSDKGQWRTVYDRPLVEQWRNVVPEVPECSEADPRFECPFCHLVLSSKVTQRREAWK